MSVPAAPRGLSAGGRALWRSLATVSMSTAERAVLLEACRTKDRLDDMDSIIKGKGLLELLHLRRLDKAGDGSEEAPVVIFLKFDDVVGKANTLAGTLSRLLRSLVDAPGQVSAAPVAVGSAVDEFAQRRAHRRAGA